MVKERPIPMSGPMVRAINDRSKTRTQRVVVPQPKAMPCWWRKLSWATDRHFKKGAIQHCPYGAPGDRLWVRESWQAVWFSHDYRVCAPKSAREGRHGCRIAYAADWPNETPQERGFPWRSPRFMPRWASRITLELTGVRVLRLRDMTERDAIAEGVVPGQFGVGNIPAAMAEPHLYQFAILWDLLNARRGYPWASNPWVWALEFQVAG